MIARPRDTQGGFSLIEVVFATLLLMLGSLALLSMVDASTRSTFRAEQSQVVVSQLQAELEKVKQLPYAQVALTATPTHVNDPADPSWRVSGSQFALAKEGTDLRSMVVNGGALTGGGAVSGGALSPAATPFESGDVSGTIRRYVVWINDPKCPEQLCPGSQDLKRVIVVAAIDSTASGGTRAYQELHTDIVNPDVTPVTDPVPPGTGTEGTFATFWLTDTPCVFDERQALTGNHLTHNTLGTCSDGPETGSTPGAPNLLSTNQIPLDPAFPADGQPLYDYSTDVEPATGAMNDRGLQVRLSGLPGCVFSPSEEDGVPEQKVHRWLSPPVPPGAELLLDGRATLSLWTQTINAAQHPGRICVFLFARKLNAQGSPVDELMENRDLTEATWFPKLQDPWPRGNWTELAVNMNFAYAARSLLPGERLGLAISVEQGGTDPGHGLEFMYDHPSFESRLQIETSSALPLFD